MTPAALGLAILATLAGMALVMTLAWGIERRIRNSGWIDVVWTAGLGAAGVLLALAPLGEAPLARRLLVAALAAAWALRLALHIAGRSGRVSDDPRYARLREDWGAAAGRKLFGFLQIQALASAPLASAILLAAHRPGPFPGWQDLAGLAVFLAGLAGSAVSDSQLRRFKQAPENRDRICDAGLWRLSRHPNYFFECVIWSSYAVLAFAPLAYPIGLVALAAPIFMTLLLTRASGIPPLEAHMLRKHGAAYEAYMARTRPLVPLPIRS